MTRPSTMPSSVIESEIEGQKHDYTKHAVKLTSGKLAAALQVASAWDEAHLSALGKRLPDESTMRHWKTEWQAKKSGKGSSQSVRQRHRGRQDRRWVAGQTTAVSEQRQEDHLLQEIARHVRCFLTPCRVSFTCIDCGQRFPWAVWSILGEQCGLCLL